MTIRKGDTIFAGNTRFIVEQIDGAYALLVWNHGGEYREMWVKLSKVPRLMIFDRLKKGA